MRKKTSWTSEEEFKRYVHVIYIYLYMIFFLVEELAFSITLLQAFKAHGCCLFDYVCFYTGWYGRCLIHFWKNTFDLVRLQETIEGGPNNQLQMEWNNPWKDDFFHPSETHVHNYFSAIYKGY